MANQVALLTKKAIRVIQANNPPRFTEETWALLMAEAIRSFNMGLEDRIDIEVKRAAVDLHDKIIGMVGEHAHNVVAYVVTAQGTRRPIDTWAQASSIYTMAMSNLSDQKALFEAHKKLQDISKTPGLDPETAKNIGGLAAELQERASAATSTSGGAIGQGGMSQAGMPTGLTIQGKKKVRATK